MVGEDLHDPEGNTKMTIIARRTVGLGRIGNDEKLRAWRVGFPRN